MSRSLVKGPFFPVALYKHFPLDFFHKIFSRASKIPFEFKGSQVLIYNGRVFRTVLLSDLNLGHRFGEFALTRTLFVPKKKKQKNKPGKSKKARK